MGSIVVPSNPVRHRNLVITILQLSHVISVNPFFRLIFLVEVEKPYEIAYLEMLINLFLLVFDYDKGWSWHLLKVFHFENLICLIFSILLLYEMVFSIFSQKCKDFLQVLYDHFWITNLSFLQKAVLKHFLRARKKDFLDHYGA